MVRCSDDEFAIFVSLFERSDAIKSLPSKMKASDFLSSLKEAQRNKSVFQDIDVHASSSSRPAPHHHHLLISPYHFFL